MEKVNVEKINLTLITYEYLRTLIEGVSTILEFRSTI